ncbi:MAG TPA: hypothetical protein VM491_13315 [Burkholderiaceae bacterium]|jgi:hypothetical protein|nr:hypothetical protein [Burkholderiaceae bacterium]
MGIDSIDRLADDDKLESLEALPKCPECENPIAAGDVVCQCCDAIVVAPRLPAPASGR